MRQNSKTPAHVLRLLGGFELKGLTFTLSPFDGWIRIYIFQTFNGQYSKPP